MDFVSMTKVPSEAGDVSCLEPSAQVQDRCRAEECAELPRAPHADTWFGSPLRLTACGQRGPVVTQRSLAAGWQAKRSQPVGEGALPRQSEAGRQFRSTGFSEAG